MKNQVQLWLLFLSPPSFPQKIDSFFVLSLLLFSLQHSFVVVGGCFDVGVGVGVGVGGDAVECFVRIFLSY